MNRFSDEARRRTAGLRAAIEGLPFNTELAAGTLAPELFRHYIIQDALYLGRFSRALAIAAAKAPDTAAFEAFGQSALRAVAVERALHENFLRGFGVDPTSLAAADPAPDCLAYTSYLIATAHHEPWPVLVAALLPCFWIYWDVGRAIAATATAHNPYRAWIDTYADPSFGEAVERVVATADRAAAAASPSVCEAMLAAFTHATRYEYLFWDGAYHRRQWPAAEDGPSPG